ncbi:hypothetical protein [Mycoplasma sp. SG1]|uniref:hypothetical protein n=1 Tax=Mycoplasma sp. SG1 TaxID=2810348 RepID=UPI002024953F|nr:hypothetical protein [Mycoplasma sp. SG1]URM53070.1 hypothetical protein JRW51_01850 [Mycoplasma sp. SG1]
MKTKNLKTTWITIASVILATGVGIGCGVAFYYIFHHSKSHKSVDYYVKKGNQEFLNHIKKVVVEDNKKDINDFYTNKFTLNNDEITKIEGWDNDKDVFVNYGKNEYGLQLFNHQINIGKLTDLMKLNSSDSLLYNKLDNTPIGILLSKTLPNFLNNVISSITSKITVPDLFQELWSYLPTVLSNYKNYSFEINIPVQQNNFADYLKNGLLNNLLDGSSFTESIQDSSLIILNNFKLPLPNMDIVLSGGDLPFPIHIDYKQIISKWLTFGMQYTYDINKDSIDFSKLKYSLTFNKI